MKRFGGAAPARSNGKGFVKLRQTRNLHDDMPFRQITPESELASREAPALDLAVCAQAFEPIANARLDLYVTHSVLGIEPHVIEVQRNQASVGLRSMSALRRQAPTSTSS